MKIAILLPIYNGVEYLVESFTSILAQTHTDWELYIGVNGHPVNSPVMQTVVALVDQYKYVDGNVNKDISHKVNITDFGVFPKDTLGKPFTLNELVKKVDPAIEWIALIDVDDIWLPTKLEEQVRTMTDFPMFDVIGTRSKYFGDLNEDLNVIAGEVPRDVFTASNQMVNSSTVIRKDLCWWDNIFGCEDYDLWIRLSLNGKRFYNSSQHLVMHRIHTDSQFNPTNNAFVAKIRCKHYPQRLIII